MDVIKTSRTEWVAAIVVAPKKNRTLRFCLNYSKLMTLTILYSYSILHMGEFVDSRGDAMIFSACDTNGRYRQAEITHEYRNNAAFSSHHVLFLLVPMRFQPENDPRTFQRAMDIVLSWVRWQFARVYPDNIAIFSYFPSDHMDYLLQILTLLKDGGLTLNLGSERSLQIT